MRRRRRKKKRRKEEKKKKPSTKFTSPLTLLLFFFSALPHLSDIEMCERRHVKDNRGDGSEGIALPWQWVSNHALISLYTYSLFASPLSPLFSFPQTLTSKIFRVEREASEEGRVAKSFHPMWTLFPKNNTIWIWKKREENEKQMAFSLKHLLKWRHVTQDVRKHIKAVYDKVMTCSVSRHPPSTPHTRWINKKEDTRRSKKNEEKKKK